MIFFGTSPKQLTIQLNPEQALLYTYRYFHIFWLLRLAYGGSFRLASMTPQGGGLPGNFPQ